MAGNAQNGSPTVPSSAEPIGQGGVLVTPVWQRFFNNLVGSPQPIVSVTASGSPFSFIASSRGTLAIAGGTVSAISLKRASTTVQISGASVPMMNGDVATVTYSAAPTLSFIPG